MMPRYNEAEAAGVVVPPPHSLKAIIASHGMRLAEYRDTCCLCGSALPLPTNFGVTRFTGTLYFRQLNPTAHTWAGRTRWVCKPCFDVPSEWWSWRG